MQDGKNCRLRKTSHSAYVSSHIKKHPHRRGEDLGRILFVMSWLETPPPAWGRPLGLLRVHLGLRNTPTGVGKTIAVTAMSCNPEKHPHRRGEDLNAPPKLSRVRETPPPAWGRPLPVSRRLPGARNTPTGVGKTILRGIRLGFHQKHPHRRGEDTGGRGVRFFPSETPPPAWGRRVQGRVEGCNAGNTPTGVGKTGLQVSRLPGGWKHPHRRGEDTGSSVHRQLITETPPPAWGRLSLRPMFHPAFGNTPTGVGKT